MTEGGDGMARTEEMVDLEEEEIPRKKRYGLARKVGKAYVERVERRKDEPDASPLRCRDPFTGSGHLHLRKEDQGKGTLIVNGSIVVHLNTTAQEYISMVFDGLPAAKIVKTITKRYKVGSGIASEDLKRLMEDLEGLERGTTPSRGSRADPLTRPYNAPFRADLAVTYRDLSSDPIDMPEQEGELTTEEWLKVLDKLWTFGIPHVCFTGGEPTVREDLVEMVDHISSLGIMTGLLTDGERIGSKAYLGRLMDAGLSYIQVSIGSHDEDVHAKVLGTPHHRKTVNGIRNALKAGIPLLVNILITKESEYGLEDTVKFLVGLGVRHMTVNPVPAEEETMPDWMLEKALERARRAAKGKARVFWFGPVPGKDPRREGEAGTVGDLAMGDLGWGEGRVHIYIHPDGNVTAGRAHSEVLGNVLTHNWSMLWFHSVLKEIRGKHLEAHRWKTMVELGFNGYPLFPGLKVEVIDDDEGERSSDPLDGKWKGGRGSAVPSFLLS